MGESEQRERDWFVCAWARNAGNEKRRVGERETEKGGESEREGQGI